MGDSTAETAERRAEHYLYGDGSGSVEGHTSGIGFALLAVAAEIRALRELIGEREATKDEDAGQAAQRMAYDAGFAAGRGLKS